MKAGIILIVIGIVLLIFGFTTRFLTLPDSFYTAGLGGLLIGGLLAFVGLVRILASKIK